LKMKEFCWLEGIYSTRAPVRAGASYLYPLSRWLHQTLPRSKQGHQIIQTAKIVPLVVFLFFSALGFPFGLGPVSATYTSFQIFFLIFIFFLSLFYLIYWI
jgi:hypothetical protein